MIFIFLTVIIVISSLFIIVSINPIHSILFLVLVFLCVNIIFILLNLHFLAFIMLIIYIGAIAILFLFVIMMLNIKTVELSFFYNKKNIPLGILLGILFLLELVVIIFNFYNSNSLTFYKHEGSIVLINYLWNFEDYSNIELLSAVFYNSLFFFVIIASLILLLAMIAAISLTLKKRNNVYNQKIYIQLIRDYNTTIKLIDNKDI